MPSGPTTTHPALGPRPMSNGRVAGSASAAPAASGPTPASRPAPLTPQPMFRLPRTDSPPNFFFSAGVIPAAASTPRTRSASASSNAMPAPPSVEPDRHEPTAAGQSSRGRLVGEEGEAVADGP